VFVGCAGGLQCLHLCGSQTFTPPPPHGALPPSLRLAHLRPPPRTAPSPPLPDASRTYTPQPALRTTPSLRTGVLLYEVGDSYRSVPPRQHSFAGEHSFNHCTVLTVSSV
jgi:hypothetical protein